MLMSLLLLAPLCEFKPSLKGCRVHDTGDATVRDRNSPPNLMPLVLLSPTVSRPFYTSQRGAVITILAGAWKSTYHWLARAMAGSTWRFMV